MSVAKQSCHISGSARDEIMSQDSAHERLSALGKCDWDRREAVHSDQLNDICLRARCTEGCVLAAPGGNSRFACYKAHYGLKQNGFHFAEKQL